MNLKAWIGSRVIGAVTTLLLATMPGSLMAQDRDDLDVTMRMVIDDEDLSGRVVQELRLPEPAVGRPGTAKPESTGAERATEARDAGRVLGRQISEEARGKREDLPADRRGGRAELPALDGRGDRDMSERGPESSLDPRPGRPDNDKGR